MLSSKQEVFMIHDLNTNLKELRPTASRPVDLQLPWGMARSVKEYGDLYFTALFDAQMWDKKSGKITTFEGHRGEVVSFKCVQEILFTGSQDNTAKMWDIKTGQCLRTFTGHQGAILVLKYLGERLIITPERLQITNKRLYTGSKDGTVKVWDPANGACQKTFKGHDGAVLALKVRANRLYTGSYDGTAKMWDIDSETCIKTYRFVSSGVSALEVTEEQILLGSFAGHIYVYNKESGECCRTLYGRLSSYRPDQLTEIWAIKAVGDLIFAADSSGKVKVFNEEGSRIIYEDGPENGCVKLVWKKEIGRLVVQIGTHYGFIDFSSQQTISN